MPLQIKKLQKRDPKTPRYRRPVLEKHAVPTKRARARFLMREKLTIADTERIVERLNAARRAKRKEWEAMVEQFPKQKIVEKTILLGDEKRLADLETFARNVLAGRKKLEIRKKKKEEKAGR